MLLIAIEVGFANMERDRMEKITLLGIADCLKQMAKGFAGISEHAYNVSVSDYSVFDKEGFRHKSVDTAELSKSLNSTAEQLEEYTQVYLTID